MKMYFEVQIVALLNLVSFFNLTKPKIVTKFAAYVAWILRCKMCKFCLKIAAIAEIENFF